MNQTVPNCFDNHLWVAAFLTAKPQKVGRRVIGDIFNVSGVFFNRALSLSVHLLIMTSGGSGHLLIRRFRR